MFEGHNFDRFQPPNKVRCFPIGNQQIVINHKGNITMNDNTKNVNNNVKLEEITGTYKGTSEYQKYSELGQSRREITGIIGVDKKANAYKMGAYIAKPFSVLGSAFGFATILVSVAHQDLFNNVWWFLFALGLGVGIFFEYLSTANEDSFVGFNITGLTKTGIILILFIKSYAVFMHYQTSEQIAKSLTNGINSSTITDTPRVALLKSQISDLTQDIKDKRAEKNTDAYAKLLVNATSAYKNKRDSATASIKAIEDDLKNFKADKKAKEMELATLTESNVAQEKADVKSDSEGMIWTFFAMLVIFELGGTLLSVLHKKTILGGVDETIAVTDEVKSRMYTKKASLEERSNTLNAFRVADEIRANSNSIKLIELESKVKEDEILLLEKARMAELGVANKELELKVKLSELDTLKHEKVIQAIEHKIQQINTITVSPYSEHTHAIPTPPPSRKMGFNTNVAKSDSMTKDDLISLTMDGVGEGDKLPPKSKLIDLGSRRQKTVYEEAMKDLVNSGRIELKKGRGYFATTQHQDFDLGDF